MKLVFSELGRNAAAQGVALIVSGRTVETLDLGDTEGLEESAVPAEEE